MQRPPCRVIDSRVRTSLGDRFELFSAVQGDHVDVLRLLLRAGAERDAPTRSGGWTPLHLACRYTSVECVVELLRWNASLGPAERPLSFTA
ncbi:unnamed protein product, partial [Ectocarpus sp. 8 AP-2014]